MTRINLMKDNYYNENELMEGLNNMSKHIKTDIDIIDRGNELLITFIGEEVNQIVFEVREKYEEYKNNNTFYNDEVTRKVVSVDIINAILMKNKEVK